MEAFYHGHSFVEIKTPELCIFVDPFIEGNKWCDLDVAEAIEKKPDAIILTHGHDDHIGNTVEILNATDALLIASFELGEYFIQTCDIPRSRVHTQWIWWMASYGNFNVKLFQAWHGGSIGPIENGINCVASGVLIYVWDTVVYHAGDTWLFGDMKLLHELYTIDIAFLPIGDRYTMWVDDAVVACSWILPKYVVPIHYNTWPSIQADAIEFARRVMLDNYAVPKVLRPWQAVIL